MSKLVWDSVGNRLYETGVDRGVLYPISSAGVYDKVVAWNGLTAVTESPSGAEATALYADNQKYLSLYSAEEFGATLEAYTYPDEFAECDGSASLVEGVTVGQQPRTVFGLAYRTKVGNDVSADSYGYKLHLIYGGKASPSEKAYQTVNDSPEAITFSWELTTTPVNVTGYQSTASLVIDSTKADAAGLKKLEALLYGADEFSESATYNVGDLVEHTDGTAVKIYVCKTAITSPAEWNADSWTEVGSKGLPLPDVVKTIMTPAAG